jgi:hypothetical protein
LFRAVVEDAKLRAIEITAKNAVAVLHAYLQKH